MPDLVILTVYRVCKKSSIKSHFTAYEQQWRILRGRGDPNPDPRKKTLADLTHYVNTLRAANTSIIMMIDANEAIDENDMKQFLEDTQLIDSFNLRHRISRQTYNGGSKQIDFILISPDLSNALKSATIHRFHDPPYHWSDHCAVSAHFDSGALLGASAATLSIRQHRHLHSENPYILAKYFNNLQKSFNRGNFLQRQQELYAIQLGEWNDEHQAALEQLDQDFTAACLRAEKACAFPTDSPWSLLLHAAYLIRQYWELRLSIQRTNRDATVRLERLIKAIDHTINRFRPEDDDIPPPLLNKETSNPKPMFRLAKKFLRQCRKRAWELRTMYYATNTELAALQDEKRKEKALRKIREKEERERTFLLLKIHSIDESDGVTQVQVPTNPLDNPREASTVDWTTVDEPKQLVETIHEWNSDHFSQAKNTPFMTAPLAEMCGYDGLTLFADKVLDGSADLSSFPPHQKDILHEMRQQTEEPMPFVDLTDEDLLQGIKKWPEKTSTSPSGRHLGHYKALSAPVRDDKNIGDSRLFHLDSSKEPSQATIRQYVLNEIRLIRRHQRPVTRWCKIWNLFLQKSPKDHRIHRHRTIHIGEADKQLVQKLDVARSLMRHAEHHGAIDDDAYGGRKGRQSTDVAWAASMVINQAHHEHRPACIFFNDLQSCYDRIIESQANMSLRSLGAPPEVLRLHANLKRNCEYYIVTKLGVSQMANRHSDECPVLGTGQGDGDGPARWLAVSLPIIRAYKNKAQPFIFKSPIVTVLDELRVIIFVDDAFTATGVLPTDPTTPDLQTIIDRLKRDCEEFINLPPSVQLLVAKITINAQNWAEYVNVPGQKLELQKCECIPLVWVSDDNGFFTISNLPENAVQIKEPDTGETKSISLRLETEACKHMGVKHRGDRSMVDMFNSKKEKSDEYATMFATTPINGVHAQISYKSSYCPKVRYGLAVTTFTFDQCHRIQQKPVRTFLAKMGFNRNIPKAIVFAPIQFGGIDMYHTYVMQGFDKIQMVTRHLRIRSSLATKFRIQLECYQLRIGTDTPALQDSRTIPHANDKWIDSFRLFLAHIDGQFLVHNLWTPNSPRKHDKCIMEEFMKLGKGAKILNILNNVRLALQVIFVSEIRDNSGSLIAGADARPTAEGTPLLWESAKSKLHWPHQPLPGEEARNLWRKCLKEIPKYENGVPPWNEHHSKEREWKQYQSRDFKFLFRRNDQGKFTRHCLSGSTRREHKYEKTPEVILDYLPQEVLPAPGAESNCCFIPFAKHTPKDPPAPPKQPQLPLVHQPWVSQMLSKAASPVKIFNTDQPAVSKLNPYKPAVENLADKWMNEVTVIASGFHERFGTTANILLLDQTTIATVSGIAPSQLASSNETRSNLSAVISGLACVIQISETRQWPIPQTVHLQLSDTHLANRLKQIFHHRASWHSLEHYDLYAELVDMVATTNLWEKVQLHGPPFPTKDETTQPLMTGAERKVAQHTQKLIKRAKKEAMARHEDCLKPQDTPECTECNPASLRLGNEIIHRSMEYFVRAAASTPELRDYLNKSYKWKGNTCDHVDWFPHGRALKNLEYGQRRTITKFIHGWLPVNKQLQTIDASVPSACVMCGEPTESQKHFLYCKHPDRNEQRHKLRVQLETWISKKATPQMTELIIRGLFEWSQSNKASLPCELDPEHLQAAQDQEIIGWHQLWRGRFSSHWGDIFARYRINKTTAAMNNSNPGITAEEWTRQLIRRIWIGVLEMWKIRNKAQHNKDENDYTTTKRLRNQVACVFIEAEELNLSQDAPFSNTCVEEITALPIARQRDWVENNTNLLNKISRAKHATAVEKTPDIRTFMLPKASRPKTSRISHDDKPP